MVNDMQRLSDAYVRFAEMSIPSDVGVSSFRLDKTVLGKTGELPLVAVPTIPLPLHGFTDGDKPPHIMAFRPTVETVGGINVPKVIYCEGSDGITHKQLVKGADDLRQDTVMEQLFTIVNELLETDSAAARRRLKIRTYRVVPLTPCAG